MGRPKKQIKKKEPVRLRTKPLNNGNKSLYLDVYYKGVRKYEYLKLYLIPETSVADKEKNKETMAIAEQIKAERILSIQSRGISSWTEIQMSRMPLVEWIKREEGNVGVMKEATLECKKCLRHQVERFLDILHKPTLGLDEVDKEFCRQFLAFLRTAEDMRYKEGGHVISENSQHGYQKALIAVLNKAVREGIIEKNPFDFIPLEERIPEHNGEKEFLTIEELRKMIATPCYRPDVKIAFLFSCFTGLRLSCIREFVPEHIKLSVDGKTQYIDKKMFKTGEDVQVPLSGEAKKYLPESKGENVPYFSLPTDVTIAKALKQWTKDAGIEKHITFHCSRVTFATTLLTLSSDIYTTSKLLGHKSIKTTEIYARVVDSKKIEATSKLDTMFNSADFSTEKTA